MRWCTVFLSLLKFCVPHIFLRYSHRTHGFFPVLWNYACLIHILLHLQFLQARVRYTTSDSRNFNKKLNRIKGENPFVNIPLIGRCCKSKKKKK